jgi:putative Mn2+ efflux pump MntP
MGFVELLFIAVGLSMDAFAVAACKGLALRKVRLGQACIVGLYFGFFQAAMPLIGYLLGSAFSARIEFIDHWIAFVLLGFLGGKMIYEAAKESREAKLRGAEAGCGACGDEMPEDDKCDKELTISAMLPLAIATSIDALAAGVTFAFLHVQIVEAVTLIGLVTFAISTCGVYLGCAFGSRFRSKAEYAGGIILILIGVRILASHLMGG